MKSLHLLAFSLLSFLSFFFFGPLTWAADCAQWQIPNTERYQFENIELISQDSTHISANVFTPLQDSPVAGFPAIIFINSWSLNEYEYVLQAKEFAEKGYAVLSYSTRGFGCSGGVVDVASSNDMADLRAAVDYLHSRTDVDHQNLGVSGISYGAGISLIGLAQDARIKTAVAMSTWASLEQALYGQETARLFWGFLLTQSGKLSGNLSPEVEQNFQSLLRNENIDYIRQWSAERSPLHYINLVNERQAPVFIANNLGDNLFQANSVIQYYKQLQGPKRLELNQGTHVSGEGLGLFGVENYTWNNVHKWFDFWLKSQVQSPDGLANFETESVSILTDLNYQREEYHYFPDESPKATNIRFYMEPRGWFSRGKLTTERNDIRPTTNRIYSGLDSGASTGIPVLSALLDGHFRLPVHFPIALLNRANGIAFQSERLSESMKIRGIPKLHLQIKSSFRFLHVVAYLYDVDKNGIGTLITHAPLSRHDLDLYQTESQQEGALQMELVATAYDVAEGHRLALVLDTYDLLYDVPTFLPYQLSLHFGPGLESHLSFPVIH